MLDLASADQLGRAAVPMLTRYWESQTLTKPKSVSSLTTLQTISFAELNWMPLRTEKKTGYWPNLRKVLQGKAQQIKCIDNPDIRDLIAVAIGRHRMYFQHGICKPDDCAQHWVCRCEVARIPTMKDSSDILTSCDACFPIL
jgi:hypothetical protein